MNYHNPEGWEDRTVIDRRYRKKIVFDGVPAAEKAIVFPSFPNSIWERPCPRNSVAPPS